MSYKLVAMDCDGTLINDQHKIPNKNKEVIKKLKDIGVKFIIATGRNDLFVKEYINELEIDSPVIGSNGATIRDLTNGVFLKKHTIDHPTQMEVYNFFYKNNLSFRAFSTEKFFHNAFEEDNVDHFRYNYNLLLKKRISFKEIYKQEDLPTEKDEIIKIVYADEDEQNLKIIQKGIFNIDGVSCYRAAKNVLDIVKKGVSKGVALMEYAKIIGVKQSEIIALGDSENDLSMFEKVGYSVTFSNADSCLKEVADLVTVDNNEGGLGIALSEIFGIC